jgi:hypothetical protein
MATKILVTKQQLLDIANTEFVNEPNYQPHLKITDAKYVGNILVLEILITSDSDMLPVLQSQEFANKISSKYTLIE